MGRDPMPVNPKTLNDENARCGCCTCLKRSVFADRQVMTIVVNRGRYLPVKSTSDLFLVQSNLYGVRHGTLVMSPERQDGGTPLIKLGREFTSVEDYLRRIPHGVPTITHLDHLTVAGDVFFGENVTLKVNNFCSWCIIMYFLVCCSVEKPMRERRRI